MRIDKFISYALNLTRKESVKIIKSKKVKVNQVIINKKDYQINENKDEVTYLDEVLVYEKFVYLMMNKPQGYVSAVRDDENTPVTDLLIEKTFSKGVYPIGRLDKDTEGLLLFTNDGKFLNSITSPKKKVYKTYLATIDSKLTPQEVSQMQAGLTIKKNKEEMFTTQKAIVEIQKDTQYKISISEGKHHQIKKMFGFFRKEVLALKRISIGNISLDTKLKPGQYRPLTTQEIEELLNK